MREHSIPSSKRLALIVKQDAEQTPQQHQRSIRHDGRNESRLLHPRCDEFGETVAPDVLVYGDGDEEGAGDWLVGIDGVGGYDGGDGRDLHAGGAEGDYDDDLPGPFSFHADGGDDVADVHYYHVGDHGDETHFGLYRRCCQSCSLVGGSLLLSYLTNTSISLCCSGGDPITQLSRSGQANDCADEDGKVEESNTLGREVVRRCSKGLSLCQVESQER